MSFFALPLTTRLTNRPSNNRKQTPATDSAMQQAATVLPLNLSADQRRACNKHINILAEQGIQFRVDGMAKQPGYVFCTATYNVSLGKPLSHEDIHKHCAPLMSLLEHAGYTALLSTWTPEEPEHIRDVHAGGRALGKQHEHLRSCYRIITFTHNKQQMMGVLRQRPPRILFVEHADQLIRKAWEEDLPAAAIMNVMEEVHLYWRHMQYARRHGPSG